MLGAAVPLLLAGLLVPVAGRDAGRRGVDAWRSTMTRAILRNIDRQAGDAQPGEKICAKLRFTVLPSGRIVGLTLVSSSGSPGWDRAALDSVRRSSPVRPLPDGKSHPVSVPLCSAG